MSFNRLLQLTSDELLQYFESRGWVLKKINNLNVMVSPGSSSKNLVTFLLPPGIEYDDHAIRLKEALLALSNFTGETVSSIEKSILDMYSLGFESLPTINLRMNTRRSDHSISIDTLEKVVENFNRLIAHSISNEIDSPVAWRPKPLQKAQDMAKEFQFGQTGSGSFIAKIVIPDRTLNQMVLFKSENLSLEEKVILRILKGFEFAHELINKDSSQITQSYSNGLNANMANALANILKATHTAGAEVLFDLPNNTVNKYNIKTQLFHATPGLIGNLKTIEDELIESSKDKLVLSCWVVGLKGKLHKQDNLLPTATLEIDPKNEVDEDMKNKRFVVELEPLEYQHVMDSYSNKQSLTVSGLFEFEKNKVTIKKLYSIT